MRINSQQTFGQTRGREDPRRAGQEAYYLGLRAAVMGVGASTRPPGPARGVMGVGTSTPPRPGSCPKVLPTARDRSLGHFSMRNEMKNQQLLSLLQATHRPDSATCAPSRWERIEPSPPAPTPDGLGGTHVLSPLLR